RARRNAQGQMDTTGKERENTARDFYQTRVKVQTSPGDWPHETDVADIFKVSNRKKKGVRPAADLLHENHKSLVDKVTYWTGMQRPWVKKLIESIESRARDMGLFADVKFEKESLTEVTVYATALAMAHLNRGELSIEKSEQKP